MSLRAVVFDVDGVLLRSMEKHAEAYREILGRAGLRITLDEVFANEGRSSPDVLATLARAHGRPLSDADVARLTAEKQALFASFGPMPLYAGAEEVVRALRARGLRLAMVTGTMRANVARHAAALLPHFEAVVTADDVRRGKPDPEPYVTALAKLGVPAGEAFAVENAPLGIRSAKGAGLRVAAVASTLSGSLLGEADLVLREVGEVAKVAEAWA